MQFENAGKDAPCEQLAGVVDKHERGEVGWAPNLKHRGTAIKFAAGTERVYPYCEWRRKLTAPPR